MLIGLMKAKISRRSSPAMSSYLMLAIHSLVHFVHAQPLKKIHMLEMRSKGQHSPMEVRNKCKRVFEVCRR